MYMDDDHLCRPVLGHDAFRRTVVYALAILLHQGQCLADDTRIRVPEVEHPLSSGLAVDSQIRSRIVADVGWVTGLLRSVSQFEGAPSLELCFSKELPVLDLCSMRGFCHNL